MGEKPRKDKDRLKKQKMLNSTKDKAHKEIQGKNLETFSGGSLHERISGTTPAPEETR